MRSELFHFQIGNSCHCAHSPGAPRTGHPPASCRNTLVESQLLGPCPVPAVTAPSWDAGQETQCHQASLEPQLGLATKVWEADVCLCSELATERSLWFSGAELRSSSKEQNAWLGAPLVFLHDFWSSETSSDVLVKSPMAVLCPMGLFTSIVAINLLPLLIRNPPELQLLVFQDKGPNGNALHAERLSQSAGKQAPNLFLTGLG